MAVHLSTYKVNVSLLDQMKGEKCVFVGKQFVMRDTEILFKKMYKGKVRILKLVSQIIVVSLTNHAC